MCSSGCPVFGIMSLSWKESRKFHKEVTSTSKLEFAFELHREAGRLGLFFLRLRGDLLEITSGISKVDGYSLYLGNIKSGF